MPAGPGTGDSLPPTGDGPMRPMRNLPCATACKLAEPGAIGASLRSPSQTVRSPIDYRFFQPYRHPDPDRPHHCAFVDAPFGDGELRLDCPDHDAAPAGQAART
jgi:hypothetical protein